MCVKTVFHPTGPCCGENALCKRWPKIDWSKTTWLVRTPDAQRMSQDPAIGFRTNEIIDATEGGVFLTKAYNYITYSVEGWTAHSSEAAVGTEMITGPDTIFGPSGFWYRGGEFLAQHAGECQWYVLNRETLLFWHLALFWAELTAVRPGDFPTNLWFVPASTILDADTFAAWQAKEFEFPEVTAIINGRPSFAYSGEVFPNIGFVGIRDVLRALACDWLPVLEARADIVALNNLVVVPKGPLQIAQELRARDPATWPNNGFLYKPTAIDLAASPWLSPGFMFGFVADFRSPLFGQFTCFEGGVETAVGDDDFPVLESVPWTLTSGPEVVAEFGVVNRFERTDAGSLTLPDWIELELVRV